MASTDRPTTPALIADLAAQPFGYDFFQALRLLQAHFSDRPPFGCSNVPADDPVRFAQNPSLAFAPSTLDDFDAEPGPGRPPRLSVHCFGLFGPNGPLPAHLTQHARERARDFGDSGLTGFLNVFHHRLIALFFKAWAVNQKTVDLDRVPTSDESERAHGRPGSRFSRYIGSAFGLGTEGVCDRDAVPDRAKLYFAGRLTHQPRNAEGLEAIVEAYFGVPARVETFFGHWLEVPAEYRCRLGRSQENATLGRNAIAGSRVWDCQLGFRLRLGPMSWSDYQRLLPRSAQTAARPEASSLDRLKAWVLNYVHEQFTWDVQLVLRADDVPPTCLGRQGRLGLTTWLKSRPFVRDAGDLVLTA